MLEKNDEIRVRLRSNGPVINFLAKEYRGGGHPLASGCYLDKEEDIEKFKIDADKVIKEYLANKEDK